MSLRSSGDIMLLSTCENEQDTKSRFLKIIEIPLSDDFKPKEGFVNVYKVTD